MKTIKFYKPRLSWPRTTNKFSRNILITLDQKLPLVTLMKIMTSSWKKKMPKKSKKCTIFSMLTDLTKVKKAKKAKKY